MSRSDLGRRPAPLVLRRRDVTVSDLHQFRSRLGNWLDQHHWPASHRISLVLAVDEASANTIRHAYPLGTTGPITLRASVRSNDTLRYAVIQIRDYGRRRWPLPDREPDPDQNGSGRGLALIRALVGHLDIHLDNTGTTLTITSMPVPPLTPRADHDPAGPPPAHGSAENGPASTCCPQQHQLRRARRSREPRPAARSTDHQLELADPAQGAGNTALPHTANLSMRATAPDLGSRRAARRRNAPFVI
jgi:anti-sigma regulatory factor (Ser/Thr protein kinase)